MALNLVSYDASDNESDVEEMDETCEETKVAETSGKFTDPTEDSNVPKPSQKELELAELAKREKANLSKPKALSQMTMKKNGRVVIGIPSLTDLEEDYKEKKLKTTATVGSKGQSKLFATLPLPKNSKYEPPEKKMEHVETSSFVKKSSSLIPQSVIKKQTQKAHSDDEDESGSFFTLDEPTLKETAEPLILPMTGMKTAYTTSVSMETTSTFTPMPTNQQYNLANVSNETLMAMNEPAPMELDMNEAMQALQGTKRKLPDDAQIIEVKAERLTYDPTFSQLKQISEERSNSNSQDFTYNKLQKKKHQITYLAAQAKAREVDLKNQWAQNKTTKRQTQAKYGF